MLPTEEVYLVNQTPVFISVLVKDSVENNKIIRININQVIALIPVIEENKHEIKFFK
jgi:hypothetical protein